MGRFFAARGNEPGGDEHYSNEDDGAGYSSRSSDELESELEARGSGGPASRVNSHTSNGAPHGGEEGADHGSSSARSSATMLRSIANLFGPKGPSGTSPAPAPARGGSRLIRTSDGSPAVGGGGSHGGGGGGATNDGDDVIVIQPAKLLVSEQDRLRIVTEALQRHQERHPEHQHLLESLVDANISNGSNNTLHMTSTSSTWQFSTLEAALANYAVAAGARGGGLAPEVPSNRSCGAASEHGAATGGAGPAPAGTQGRGVAAGQAEPLNQLKHQIQQLKDLREGPDASDPDPDPDPGGLLPSPSSQENLEHRPGGGEGGSSGNSDDLSRPGGAGALQSFVGNGGAVATSSSSTGTSARAQNAQIPSSLRSNPATTNSNLQRRPSRLARNSSTSTLAGNQAGHQPVVMSSTLSEPNGAPGPAAVAGHPPMGSRPQPLQRDVSQRSQTPSSPPSSSRIGHPLPAAAITPGMVASHASPRPSQEYPELDPWVAAAAGSRDGKQQQQQQQQHTPMRKSTAEQHLGALQEEEAERAPPPAAPAAARAGRMRRRSAAAFFSGGSDLGSLGSSLQAFTRLGGASSGGGQSATDAAPAEGAQRQEERPRDARALAALMRGSATEVPPSRPASKGQGGVLRADSTHDLGSYSADFDGSLMYEQNTALSPRSGGTGTALGALRRSVMKVSMAFAFKGKPDGARSAYDDAESCNSPPTPNLPSFASLPELSNMDLNPNKARRGRVRRSSINAITDVSHFARSLLSKQRRSLDQQTRDNVSRMYQEHDDDDVGVCESAPEPDVESGLTAVPPLPRPNHEYMLGMHKDSWSAQSSRATSQDGTAGTGGGAGDSSHDRGDSATAHGHNHTPALSTATGSQRPSPSPASATSSSSPQARPGGAVMVRRSADGSPREPLRRAGSGPGGSVLEITTMGPLTSDMDLEDLIQAVRNNGGKRGGGGGAFGGSVSSHVPAAGGTASSGEGANSYEVASGAGGTVSLHEVMQLSVRHHSPSGDDDGAQKGRGGGGGGSPKMGSLQLSSINELCQMEQPAAKAAQAANPASSPQLKSASPRSSGEACAAAIVQALTGAPAVLPPGSAAAALPPQSASRIGQQGQQPAGGSVPFTARTDDTPAAAAVAAASLSPLVRGAAATGATGAPLSGAGVTAAAGSGRSASGDATAAAAPPGAPTMMQLLKKLGALPPAMRADIIRQLLETDGVRRIVEAQGMRLPPPAAAAAHAVSAPGAGDVTARPADPGEPSAAAAQAGQAGGTRGGGFPLIGLNSSMEALDLSFRGSLDSPSEAASVRATVAEVDLDAHDKALPPSSIPPAPAPAGACGLIGLAQSYPGLSAAGGTTGGAAAGGPLIGGAAGAPPALLASSTTHVQQQQHGGDQRSHCNEQSSIAFVTGSRTSSEHSATAHPVEQPARGGKPKPAVPDGAGGQRDAAAASAGTLAGWRPAAAPRIAGSSTTSCASGGAAPAATAAVGMSSGAAAGSVPLPRAESEPRSTPGARYALASGSSGSGYAPQLPKRAGGDSGAATPPALLNQQLLGQAHVLGPPSFASSRPPSSASPSAAQLLLSMGTWLATPSSRDRDNSSSSANWTGAAAATAAAMTNGTDALLERLADELRRNSPEEEQRMVEVLRHSLEEQELAVEALHRSLHSESMKRLAMEEDSFEMLLGTPPASGLRARGETEAEVGEGGYEVAVAADGGSGNGAAAAATLAASAAADDATSATANAVTAPPVLPLDLEEAEAQGELPDEPEPSHHSPPMSMTEHHHHHQQQHQQQQRYHHYAELDQQYGDADDADDGHLPAALAPPAEAALIAAAAAQSCAAAMQQQQHEATRAWLELQAQPAEALARQYDYTKVHTEPAPPEHRPLLDEAPMAQQAAPQQPLAPERMQQQRGGADDAFAPPPVASPVRIAPPVGALPWQLLEHSPGPQPAIPTSRNRSSGEARLPAVALPPDAIRPTTRELCATPAAPMAASMQQQQQRGASFSGPAQGVRPQPHVLGRTASTIATGVVTNRMPRSSSAARPTRIPPAAFPAAYGIFDRDDDDESNPMSHRSRPAGPYPGGVPAAAGAGPFMQQPPSAPGSQHGVMGAYAAMPYGYAGPPQCGGAAPGAAAAHHLSQQPAAAMMMMGAGAGAWPHHISPHGSHEFTTHPIAGPGGPGGWGQAPNSGPAMHMLQPYQGPYFDAVGPAPTVIAAVATVYGIPNGMPPVRVPGTVSAAAAAASAAAANLMAAGVAAAGMGGMGTVYSPRQHVVCSAAARGDAQVLDVPDIDLTAPHPVLTGSCASSGGGALHHHHHHHHISHHQHQNGWRQQSHHQPQRSPWWQNLGLGNGPYSIPSSPSRAAIEEDLRSRSRLLLGSHPVAVGRQAEGGGDDGYGSD